MSLEVAVAIPMELATGGCEDKGRSGPNAIRKEQIEKVLERKTRRSWLRKESARSICEAKFSGRNAGATVTRLSVWAASVAVDVEKSEVAK